MQIIGNMFCQCQEEVDSVLGKLKGLPVEVKAFGFGIDVEYTPSDTQTDAEAEKTAARLIDIIESVKIHGFSQMAEKR